MTQFSFFNIESNLWCFIDDFLQCEFLENFLSFKALVDRTFKKKFFFSFVFITNSFF